MTKQEQFLAHTNTEHPIICGPMYPCSNPELVAAASAAGVLGVIQPISLTYVYGYDFREGIRYMRTLTDKPLGFNALIEKSSKTYHEKMVKWVDIALEEGIRFFITSLGNPKWVVDRVSQVGGVVYHDVTEKKWAQKGLDNGAQGLIAVNNDAGGHAGEKSSEQLFSELSAFDVPIVCAGGIAENNSFKKALTIGYAGAQLGTAFIATNECVASERYKQAIVNASAEDILLTERLTGVPVSVIGNEYVKQLGTNVGPITRWMLGHRKFKHWARTLLALRSLHGLKRLMVAQKEQDTYWQAGKSVAGVGSIMSVEQRVAKIISSDGC